jgi:Leucine-rich repeat (LRR) protein
VDHNTISGGIPTEIGLLSSLEDVRMVNCSLTGKIPQQVKHLSSLVRLELNDNELAGSIPATLGSASTLEHVDLRNNALNGSMPSEVCKHFSGASKKNKYLLVDCAEVNCTCCTNCPVKKL